MFVQIRCSNPGHPGRARAGRHFVNGQTYRMEVVKAPRPDPAKQKPGEPRGWPLGRDGHPSMDEIDMIDLARVKADPCFSVLEGGDTNAALSEAAFQEARVRLKEATAALDDAKITFATQEATIAELQKTNDELRAHLKAALEAQEAPPTPPIPAPTGDAPKSEDVVNPEPKGNGKKK